MKPATTEQPPVEELLSVPDFAKLAPAALTTVHQWIGQRRIESVKLGRRVFIPLRELHRLRDEGRRPAFARIAKGV